MAALRHRRWKCALTSQWAGSRRNRPQVSGAAERGAEPAAPRLPAALRSARAQRAAGDSTNRPIGSEQQTVAFSPETVNKATSGIKAALVLQDFKFSVT
ncbi:uncharacterized protein V6R79_022739 [Siganus canaliculatus]